MAKVHQHTTQLIIDFHLKTNEDARMLGAPTTATMTVTLLLVVLEKYSSREALERKYLPSGIKRYFVG